MGEAKVCSLWHVASGASFMELSDEEKQAFSTFMTHIKIKKTGFVYSAGDSSDMLYVIMSGRIKTTRLSDDGREITLDILEPGDIFGELTITGEGEREATAVALEDSVICAVRRNDFEEFIKKSPLFSFSITKMIGSRLRAIENRYENIIFRDVKARLVSLLEDLSERYGEDTENGRLITIKLSHQELAGLVGSTRETVTLELNKLKKSGQIKTEGRHFILPRH